MGDGYSIHNRGPSMNRVLAGLAAREQRLLDLLRDAARQLEVGGVNTKDAIALIVRIEQELAK